jgi:hypothetical protein
MGITRTIMVTHPTTIITTGTHTTVRGGETATDHGMDGRITTTQAITTDGMAIITPITDITPTTTQITIATTIAMGQELPIATPKADGVVQVQHPQLAM